MVVAMVEITQKIFSVWNLFDVSTVFGGASEISFSEYRPWWKEHDKRDSTIFQKEQASLQGLVYHAQAEKRWDAMRINAHYGLR